MPRERGRTLDLIHSHLTGLWQSDLTRPRRPTVAEEIEQGLHFSSSLWLQDWRWAARDLREVWSMMCCSSAGDGGLLGLEREFRTFKKRTNGRLPF